MTCADLLGRITIEREVRPRERALLVAISGIDAAGKGTLARDLVERLRVRGTRVALVGADGWLTPNEGLDLGSEPGVNFYRRGFWFDAMFERVVDPLCLDRSIDVVLLEGIFLFKKELRHRYDLTIWVDCRFETALRRALVRNQERLPADRLLADYARIYFPAQEVHLARDNPRAFADILYANDLQAQNS
jgi:uridine kinase